MNLRTFIVLLAVALVATFGWWLRDFALRPARTVEEPGPQYPDYFMDRFKVTGMAPSGTPRYHLTAETLQHYRGRATAELQAPQVTFFSDNGAPVELRAEQGSVSDDGQVVKLTGKVQIHRAASGDNGPLRIVSSELLVRPNEHYVETDEFVRIRGQAGRLEGRGLRAWLGEGRLQLLSTVRGHYENP